MRRRFRRRYEKEAETIKLWFSNRLGKITSTLLQELIKM